MRKKSERIRIYNKIALEFEKRDQNTSICYAFHSYFPKYGMSHKPYLLLQKFPELQKVWFENVTKIQKDNYEGFSKISSEFKHNKNKMDDFRATLLYLAALQ